MMFNLGPGEITVLLLLGVIFFGSKRVPELFDETSVELRRSSPRKLPDWTTKEWRLVVIAVLLAATAAALVVFRS
jgi:hypothetical protein